MAGHRFRLITVAGDEIGIRSFAVPNWTPGDTIAVGRALSYVVVEVLAADPPVLIVRRK